MRMTSKAVAEMWNRLDKEGRLPYKEEGEKLKGKYVKEVEDFKGRKGGEGNA